MIHKVNNNSADSCFVYYEAVKNSNNILVAGNEFQFTHNHGNYRYWHCRYRRTNPKTCGATCRQEIDTKSPQKVEFIKKHNDAGDSLCPYVSGITDKILIKLQYQKHTDENDALKKIQALLEENPSWDMTDLKSNIHKLGIDISSISTTKIDSKLREHKRMNRQKGFNAVLESPKTKSGATYLRECCQSNINVLGSEAAIKYIIWASPAQLLRLRSSEHWYIDGTFRICPDSFTQLLIIMCRDPVTNTPSPDCYILVNSKTTNSYTKVFRGLEALLTCYNKVELKLKSATADFEQGLHLGLLNVFPKIRLIGCLFHFKQALHRRAAKLGLKKKKYMHDTQRTIEQISRMCWQDSPLTHLKGLKQRIKLKLQVKLINYVQRTWSKFILKNMLNYKTINQEYRANSILESYNVRVKKILPYKPNWPKFVEFLIDEENYYNLEILRKMTQGETSIPNKKPRKAYEPKSSNKRNKNGKSSNQSKKISNRPLDDQSMDIESSQDFYDDYEDVEENEEQDDLSDIDYNELNSSFQSQLVIDKNKKKRRSDQIDPREEFSNTFKSPLQVPKPTLRNRSIRFIEWGLTNKDDSCRYSSFFTLFRFKLIYLHPAFSKQSKLKGSSLLNKIIETNGKFQHGNSKQNNQLIELFSQYSTKMKFEFDKYGSIGSISALFSAFSCLDICTLKVKESKSCLTCEFTRMVDEKSIGPLFSVSEENGLKHGIAESLRLYLAARSWICEFCKGTTTSSSREILSLPKVLFVVLDFDYQTLANFYRYEEQVSLNNNRFSLVAAITKPTENHFSLLVKDPKQGENSTGIGNWYRYNDLKADGDLIFVGNNINNSLKEDQAYILIFYNSADL